MSTHAKDRTAPYRSFRAIDWLVFGIAGALAIPAPVVSVGALALAWIVVLSHGREPARILMSVMATLAFVALWLFVLTPA